jgi:hypothetical protein
VTVEERLEARRRIREAYRLAVAPGDREALLEVGMWCVEGCLSILSGFWLTDCLTD